MSNSPTSLSNHDPGPPGVCEFCETLTHDVKTVRVRGRRLDLCGQCRGNGPGDDGSDEWKMRQAEKERGLL